MPVVLVLTLWLATAGTSGASNLVPLGPEFRVSPVGATYYNRDDGQAFDPWAARFSNGNFVVAWEAYDYDYDYGYINTTITSGEGVFARRFDRTGKPMGGPVVVHFVPDADTFSPLHPSMAVDGSDRFIVVWGTYEEVEGEPESGRIWARRFNAAGNPLGQRFQVNETEAEVLAQTFTGVAAAANGSFLVTWESLSPEGPNARVFDGNAAPVTSEFHVNTTPQTSRAYPATTANGDDEFVVMWQSFAAGVRGQRIANDGTAIGTELTLLDHDNNEVQNRVAAAPNGNFMVIGFQSDGALSARVFNQAGAPLTDEFVIDDDPSASTYGGVDAGPDGDFVVAWQRHQYGPVLAQRFQNDGAPDGPAVTIADSEAYPIENPGLNVPSIAIDDKGDFVVVWSDAYAYSAYTPVAGDREGPGIWGRMYHVCGNDLVGQSETCDDGNAIAGDGCSDRCDREACFSCTTAEPSVCSPIAGCNAVCRNGAAIQDTVIMTFQGLSALPGFQSYKLKGNVPVPPMPAGAWDPSIDGMEIAITSTGLVHGLFTPTPIPPGVPGTGCGSADGWKVKLSPTTRSFTYKNTSDALPPACLPGSARGLRGIKVREKIATGGSVEFDVKVSRTTLDTLPAPPLQVALVFGQSPTAGESGLCARAILTRAIGARFYP